jgi:ADP-heptose:LPS heptosyltransferase
LKKILIYNSGGGIGDAIQIINLLVSLHEHYNNHEIYLLQAHQNNLFEKSLKGLNLNFIKKSPIELMYFGFRIKHYFQLNSLIKNNNIFFDIIIDLQSKLRNTIILKKIPHNIFISSTYNNLFLKPKLKINNKEKNIIRRIANYINILNDNKFIFKKYNIDLINKVYFEEANRLLPNDKYVGISMTQGNLYRKKTLSLCCVLEFTKYLLSIKKKPVFLIEKKHFKLKEEIEKQLNGVFFPEFNTNLNDPCLLISLAKKMDYAISIDNGVMHLLSLANIPMITIFGPTSSDKFAPEINNIKILSSQKLFNSKNINLITSKIIIEQIDLLEKEIILK